MGEERTMNIYFYDTDLGRIGIAERSGRITALYFEGEDVPEKTEVC